eukprot:360508-Chlamydomonas_euryale.AAC.12
MLVRAYELDPHHVGVLNTLSHYCLLRGDHEKVGVGKCVTQGGSHISHTEAGLTQAGQTEVKHEVTNAIMGCTR